MIYFKTTWIQDRKANRRIQSLHLIKKKKEGIILMRSIDGPKLHKNRKITLILKSFRKVIKNV